MSALEEPQVADVDLEDPALYFNRELSWLEFNQRVIELAEDPDIPLLERLKFVAIAANNLDEFFMVRVAGLHDQVDAGIETPLQDGRTPRETLDAIRGVVAGHIRAPGALPAGRAAPGARRARDPHRPARRRLRATSASASTSASGARSSPS